jgi:hypothetical protein
VLAPLDARARAASKRAESAFARTKKALDEVSQAQDAMTRLIRSDASTQAILVALAASNPKGEFGRAVAKSKAITK